MSYNGQAFGASTSFAPSSWSSNLGVAEAIASYRRSQYILTAQNVASGSQSDIAHDEEAALTDADEREDGHCEHATDNDLDADQNDDIVNTLDWDGFERPSPSTPTVPTFAPRRPSASSARPNIRVPVTERTPLVNFSGSRSSLKSQRPNIISTHATETMERSNSLQVNDGQGSAMARELSTASIRSEKRFSGGRSTFGQTLFNSIAILLGFGMLSEPLAFSYAGWIGGSFLILFYGFITCYTAKILAHIILEDPEIRTYADIGHKAFGPRSRFMTSALFCMELFAVTVVLVTLFGDSLHSILPAYTATTYKICGLVILLPTVFLPLSVLSYSSMLGIFSTLMIIIVVILDGLSKSDAPGSLWSPADTNIGISNWGNVGVAFGLFMAGFSGHAVLPSLAKDMEHPEHFDEMIDWAFFVATVIYGFIGACGYLMFGDAVSDEVSKDLIATPGYNVFLNKFAMWSLVVIPVTKFALTARPVNITLEVMLGIETSPLPYSPEEDARNVSTPASRTEKSARLVKQTLMVLERSAFTILAVTVSILVPDFGSMMAFLGSFSAFMLCVIGPVSAKVMLAGRCGLEDAALLVVATVMAVWGTVAAFTA